MRTLFFSLFLFSFCLLGAEEQVYVKLATENSLSPLYLFPFDASESSLEPSYIKELEKVLLFDLSHNGKTEAVALQIQASEGQKSISLSSWAEKGVAYVVKIEISKEEAKPVVLDVAANVLRRGQSVKWTGNLAFDRRAIHQIADGIYKALFDADGIASTRLLYALNQKNGSDSTKWVSSLLECDFDGKNVRKVLGESKLIVNPVYIPPEKGFLSGAILFVSYASGQSRLRIASLKTGAVNPLVKLSGSQMMPAVSKAQDKIAFISDASGNPDLFVQSFSLDQGPIGKPQQVFSARHAAQGSPTFSPDGKKVAFVSNKDGSPRIYILTVPPPGTSIRDIRPKLITRKNRENTAPSWSPDGTKIAYCARSSDKRQIWVYDIASNEETMLTDSGGDKENPSWAPNSLVLVYNSSDQENNNLFILNLHGDGEGRQITAGPGDKRFPCWEPR